jgi:uncharacterized protein (TIGR03435 family)
MMSPRLLAALHLGPLLLSLACIAPASSAQADGTYVPAMAFATVTLHDSEGTDSCDLAHAFVLGTSAFGANNCDLTSLIAQAYGLRRDQIVGLPNQIFTYDVIAKADAASEARIGKLPPRQQQLEQHHMLQTMLADRFKLIVHSESRAVRSFDLVVGRLGPMMEPAEAEDDEQKDPTLPRTTPLTQGGDNEAGFYYVAHAASMNDLAGVLSEQFNRTVFDKTGLTGKYDFDLHYRGLTSHDSASADGVPPLDEAIQWQLGLRLKPSRGLELYLVIDHVDKPTLDR